KLTAHPLAPVPGDVRMVQGQPRQTRSVRTQNARRVKVVAGNYHLAAIPLAIIQLNARERVHGFTAGDAVVFSHTDQSLAPVVYYEVGIAHSGQRSDKPRRSITRSRVK